MSFIPLRALRDLAQGWLWAADIVYDVVLAAGRIPQEAVEWDDVNQIWEYGWDFNLSEDSQDFSLDAVVSALRLATSVL